MQNSKGIVLTVAGFVVIAQLQVTYLTATTTHSTCTHYGLNKESTCINFNTVTTEVCCPGFICGNCTDHDECKYGLAPCLHRGHCHNTLGGFTCSCLEGWMGDHCEGRVPNKTSSCIPGWSGEHCSVRLCIHGILVKDSDVSTQTTNTPNTSPMTSSETTDVTASDGTTPTVKCRCDAGWTGDTCNVSSNSDVSTTTHRMSRPTTGMTVSSSHKDASKSPKKGVIIGATVGGVCVVAASIAVAIVAVKYNIIRKNKSRVGDAETTPPPRVTSATSDGGLADSDINKHNAPRAQSPCTTVKADV